MIRATGDVVCTGNFIGEPRYRQLLRPPDRGLAYRCAVADILGRPWFMIELKERWEAVVDWNIIEIKLKEVTISCHDELSSKDIEAGVNYQSSAHYLYIEAKACTLITEC